MHASTLDPNGKLRTATHTTTTTPLTSGPRVLTCLDSSPLSRKAIAPAAAIARALSGELALMRVLEAGSDLGTPPDPVAWDIHRRHARDVVEQAAREHEETAGVVHTDIVEGRAADEICRWVRDNDVDLAVLCTHGEGGASELDLGGTARQVLQSAPCPILLVPAGVELADYPRYRRILVPLDGSARAESALPIALRIAEAENADLVLVHAVPEPELTALGPLEPEDIELRERLIRRNERVAREYLDRVRAHLAPAGVTIRTLVVSGGDTRHVLARVIDDEAPDLVVLASHGHTALRDAPIGGVACYLIAHPTTPLLIVRAPPSASRPHDLDRRDVQARLPARAFQ